MDGLREQIIGEILRRFGAEYHADIRAPDAADAILALVAARIKELEAALEAERDDAHGYRTHPDTWA